MDNTTEDSVDFETKQDNGTCVNFDSLAIPESNSLSFGYDPQQILFGAIQFVIVTMFLLLHVPMMKNVYSRCDRTPATIGYKLIVFLAIVDEIQLVTHLYASIMMIFNLRTPVAPVLILGAFIDGAWFTTITLTFTITVFRFIVIAVDFLKYYFVTNIAFFASVEFVKKTNKI